MVFLKAAINGSRAAEDHPALPVSAAAIAADAQAVVKAGASAVHFHVRDEAEEETDEEVEGGFESLAPEDAARCILACRASAPGIPLGISTGAWIAPDLDERLTLLRAWQVLPDFVSVNFREEGAAEVAKALHERGIGIEVGLADAADAERALAAGWGNRCLRILLEPREETVEAALTNVAAMERLLDQAGATAPRLLHGYNATAWTLLKEAIKRGYQCRIGLEDTLRLANGDLAVSNEEMIRAALEMAS